MKYNEIMAAIQQLKNTVANVQCEIAALEELLVANENHQEETPDETPVVNEVSNEASNVPIIEEEVEELPAPPAEVHIDIPEDNAPDEDAILGCKIITDLGIDYSGVCSVIKMHKLYFDNGQPKLYINKYKVVIDLCNSKMEVIKTVTTHWNNLAKFHTELIARGINTHAKENWMPKTVLLDLD
jgi:hypothetical protein